MRSGVTEGVFTSHEWAFWVSQMKTVGNLTEEA